MTNRRRYPSRIGTLLLQLASLVLLASVLPGQQAFWQALRDAGTDTRALIVATHPDDTYRGLAVVLRRVFGYRVSVLVATRGEGGQNAVGPEQGAALGRIRSEESFRASEILDVDLAFLDLPDFGYCRDAAEALDRWKAFQAGERLRRSIREKAPDLVFTPHGRKEAHGQKRAVFNLLESALQAKEFRTLPFFVAAKDGDSVDWKYDLEERGELAGESFREIAHRALLCHATQGPHASTEESTERFLAYHCLRGAVSQLHRRSGFRDLGELRNKAQEARVFGEGGVRGLEALLEAPRRASSVEAARAGALLAWKRARAVADRASAATRFHARLGARLKALERAIFLSTNLLLHWDVPESFPDDLATLGSKLSVENRGKEALRFRVLAVDLDARSGLRLLPSSKSGWVDVGPGVVADLPIRLVRDRQIDHRRRERIALHLVFKSEGVEFRWTLRRDLMQLPSLEIHAVPEDQFLVPAEGGEVRFSLRIRKSFAARYDAVLEMTGPDDLAFLPETDRQSLPIRLSLPSGEGERLLPLRVRLPNWSERRPTGRLPWLNTRFRLRPSQDGAASRTRSASCRISFLPTRIRVPVGLRIGILRGPDDTIEEALRSFGLAVTALDERTLARVSIDDYDTILVDSRALSRRRDVRAQVPRLLAYARRSGHLVVLYHKPQEFNQESIRMRLAPYAMKLGRERVTREDAAVRVLLPKHRLMTVPNRIRPRDWDGWVQERGLYFPETGAYSSEFEELLEIQEPSFEEGKPSPFAKQRGSLLFARTGGGSYVYCALVLHRQLRAFHEGAARLLVNLVTPASWKRF